jgi:hypothetical protein
MQCSVDIENPRTEIEVYVSKLLTDYKLPELKEEKPMATKKTKSNRISIATMDDILKRRQETETVQWNGLDVVIKKDLAMDDMLNFVDSVVRSCFDAQTGEYRPEAKDFAMRANILTRYANFALPEKNTEHQYEIAVFSGAADMVLRYVNAAQFNEMSRAIDEKIAYMASANIQVLTKRFDDVVMAFQKLQSDIGKQFAGVGDGELAALVKAASNSSISEEALVKEYFKQKAAACHDSNQL